MCGGVRGFFFFSANTKYFILFSSNVTKISFALCLVTLTGLKEFPSYIICPDYSCSLTVALIALTASLFTVNSHIWHLTVCV